MIDHNCSSDQIVTFHSIQVECDGKDCTDSMKWQPMVKDPNCNMKAHINSARNISITWDVNAQSAYDNVPRDELVRMNAKGWAATYLPLNKDE